MTEDCSDIPSQQSNTDLYIPVCCLQQSGTDRFAGAETCNPRLEHKEYSEKIWGKENLMIKKQLQAVEEFNTANGNKMSYRSMSQTNYWCEPKLSET
jgi:hypothetical protein